jgi:hypothetical protein
MPSQSNFGIVLNFAPIDGNVTIDPIFGYSIYTVFNIRAIDYRDEDLPLSYKYSYYL